jgi:hypothetical protein
MTDPDAAAAVVVDDYAHLSHALGRPIPAKIVRTDDGRCVTCRLLFKDPDPRVAVLLDIISSEEAAAVIAAGKPQCAACIDAVCCIYSKMPSAAPKLHRSRVVGRETTDGRTSWSCGLPRCHAAVAPICQRLAKITGYRVEQFETVQCVRYSTTQEYSIPPRQTLSLPLSLQSLADTACTMTGSTLRRTASQPRCSAGGSDEFPYSYTCKSLLQAGARGFLCSDSKAFASPQWWVMVSCGVYPQCTPATAP